MEAAFVQNVIRVQEYTCHNPEDYSLKRTVTVFMALSFCKKMVFAYPFRKFPHVSWNCLVQCSFEPATGPFLSRADPVCVLIA